MDWACPLLSMCLQNLLFHERQRGIIARMGELLTMYVSHAFPGDATATGPSALQSLFEHARNRGFDVVGDYYEESVCRWPQVFDERGEILVHCRLPVRQGERR